jgi:uncharacterized OB-fold protein
MNGTGKNVCGACGRGSYPRHACCPSCGRRDFETRGFEGEATLLTFTHVHMLSLAYTDLFITLGIVQFPDGTRALGRLDVDRPEVGMKLKAKIGIVRSDGLREIEGLRFARA